jgi:hypothetical protein
MSDIQPYVPLKQVVSLALDECEKSIGSFDQFWLFAFRGLVDLLYDIAWEPITVRLPINGNKTVSFPVDCISWLKIGILNNNGEVSTLKINNSLTTLKDKNPNRLNYLTADITDGLPFLLNSPYYLNYFYDGVYQPLFGVGGGLIQHDSCRVDDENRVVILPPDFKYNSIIFEYLSSPEKNSDYTVKLSCQEALIAFIKWKAKQGTRQDYMAEKINARRRQPKKQFNLQHFNQVIRESRGMKLLS